MAEKLKYQIDFTVDTSSLYNSLKGAIEALNQLGQNPRQQLTTSLREASQAALDLSTNLRNAYNQDTGKLDLSEFNRVLRKNGQSITDYAKKITEIGPAGEQAFMQVAQAIAKAELPVRRTNKLLDDMWVTLKNTVRWQVTSNALNAITGQIESAVQYTKNLDDSLNSIRIVTEKSSEEMDKFAEKANKAAKALSTTTTRYSDASLIYYQQGLSDEEVEGRVDTTIKLANVSNEDARIASEQMTAIWNNFYDGSKSLEYYADAMAALGASTASSTQEISTGLQKFASVAGTVGLSYEYAASALATITATTRESADIVGTSLRTLFSRIQGLNQDEEQEDGTTLNKYSKALAQVGIDIKDTSGKMKEMDTILNEMGERWTFLSKAQQLALAQTVAGVRQYTQLITLMENWEFFQENLQTAYGSEGTLEKQAEIFAESWEAAKARVRAATEDIYDSLINEQFFIDLDNMFTPVLGGIAQVADSLGGMRGILGILGVAITEVFGDKIANQIRETAVNLDIITGVEGARTRELQKQTVALVEQMGKIKSGNEIEVNRFNLLKEEIQLQGAINQKWDSLDESQQKIIKNEQYKLELIKQENNALSDRALKLQEDTENQESILSAASDQNIQKNKKWKENLIQQIENWNSTHQDNTIEIDVTTNADEIFSSINNEIRKLIQARGPIRQISEELDKIQGKKDKETYLRDRADIVKGILLSDEDIDEENIDRIIDDIQKNSIEMNKMINQYSLLMSIITGTDKETQSYVQTLKEQASVNADLNKSNEITTSAYKKMNEIIEEAGSKNRDFADKIVSVVNGISQIAIGIQAFQNLGRIFSDEDMTTSERFLSALTTMTSLIPLLNSSMQIFNTQKTLSIAIGQKNILVEQKTISSLLAEKIARKFVTEQTKEDTAVTIAHTAAKVANIAVIAGIALVVAGAVVGIYKLVEAQQAEAKAAKEAAEQQEKLNDLLTKAKNEYDELARKIKNYQSARDALDQLKIGTSEYADAIKSANEQAEQLIGNNIRLQALAKRNPSSGLITFNEEELQSYIEEQQKYLSNMEAASYLAQINTNDANLQLKRSNLQNRIFGFEDVSTGRARQTVRISDSQLEQVLEIIQKTGNIMKSDLDTIAGMNDLLKQSILEHSNDLKALSVSIDTNSEANKYLKEQIAESFVSGTPEYQMDSISKNQAVIAAVSYISNSDLYKNELFKQQNKSIQYSENEIQQRYAEIMGYSTSLIDNKVFGKATYYDQSGKIVAEKISDDIARQVVAQVETYQFIFGKNSDLQKIIPEAIEKLYGVGETFSQDIANGLLRFVGQKDNLKGLSLNDLTPEQIDQLQSIDISQILSKEEIEALGYESAQDFLNALTKVIQTYDFIQHLNIDAEEAAKKSKQIGEILFSYQHDEELNESQLAFLDKLKDEYEALNEIQDTGSHKYLRTLRAIQELEEDIELQDLRRIKEEQQRSIQEDQEKLRALIAARDSLKGTDDIENLNVVIVAKTEELDKKLEELQNTDYQIQVKINADLATDVDQAFGLANEISRLQGYLSESLEISYDAAQEIIAAGYGEMLQSAQETANQTIQLNREVVNNFIDGKEQEIEANRQSKIKQLELENINLQAKQDALSKGIEALEQSLKTEDTAAMASALAQASYYNAEANSKRLAEEDKEQYVEESNSEQAKSTERLIEALGLSYTANVENIQQANADAEESYIKSGETALEVIDQIGAQVQQLSDAIRNAPNGTANYIPSSGINVTQKVTIGATEMQTPENTFDVLDHSIGQITRDLEEIFGDNQNFAKEVVEQAIESMKSAQQQIENQKGANDAAIAALKSAKLSLNTAQEGAGLGKEGKTYDAEDLKKLEDIEDRYHEINREILRQNDLLDDIEHNIDRAYGGEKLKGFSQQLTALQKQQENYQEKLAEAQERYLPQDIAKLQELFNNVTIKANGELANYEDLLRQVVDDHNNFLILYNQFLAEYSAMTQAEQEANATALEAWNMRKEMAETNYQARLDALKQYEDTRDTIQDIKDAIEDNARAMADAKLSQVEYKLEIVLDVKEMRDALREFDKQVNEIFGDALTHGLPVAHLDYEQAQAEANMYPEYKRQFEELKELYEGSDEYMDRDRIIQDIKDLQGKVLDSAEAIVEWVNSIEDLIPNAVDAARERYKLFTDQLEHNTTVLDTIKELYTLQGVTYKTMDGFNRLQKVSQERMEAQLAQAELQKAWYDEARIRLEDAQAKLDSLNGDETDFRYDTYKKARDAYLQEFNEAEEAYLSLAKEAMETAQQMYEEKLEKALYNFGQIVSKGIGLDLLQDKYDHYIEQNERYFDKVDEAYQTTAWFNKLQEDIDKAINAATKDRLKALQEEINIRRENNTLSQYDLNILNAKYEVLKAQMALEDAQNAKNKLKLVRDSQGNWNYQYVADENQIANAQQELIEKQNQWYQIAKEQVTQVTGEIVDTWRECQEKIKEIYSDMTLTDEERADRAAEIYKYYTDKIKYLENEKQVAISDMTEAGNAGLFSNAVIMGDKLTDLTGLTSSDIKAIIQGTGVDIIGLLSSDSETIKKMFFDNWDTIISLLDEDSGILKSIVETNGDYIREWLIQNNGDIKDAIASDTDLIKYIVGNGGDFLIDLLGKDSDFMKHIVESSGYDIVDIIGSNNNLIMDLVMSNTKLFDLFDNIYAKDLDDMTTSTVKFEDVLQDTLDRAEKDFEDFRDTVIDVGDRTGTKIDDLDDKTNELSYSTDRLRDSGIDAASALWEMIRAVELAAYDYADMAQSIWGTVEALRALAAAQVNYVASKVNTSTGGNYTSTTTKPVTTPTTKPTNKYPEEKNPSTGAGDPEELKKYLEELRRKHGTGGAPNSDFLPFDTGGYTGNFEGGRIALLHQKELVLNQDDTKNVLAAVDITRDMFAEIEKALDGNGIAAMALMAQKLATPRIQSTSDSIEQTIHIDTIEFPNVTSSNEIEEAIISIANDAAQWAKRRKE